MCLFVLLPVFFCLFVFDAFVCRLQTELSPATHLFHVYSSVLSVQVQNSFSGSFKNDS